MKYCQLQIKSMKINMQWHCLENKYQYLQHLGRFRKGRGWYLVSLPRVPGPSCNKPLQGIHSDTLPKKRQSTSAETQQKLERSDGKTFQIWIILKYRDVFLERTRGTNKLVENKLCVASCCVIYSHRFQ